MTTRHYFALPVMALSTMLFTPISGSAQSVLLTAGEFALLGSTSITVGGPGPNAIVNGHVGLSTAATSNITGFPPATVSGITPSGAPAAIIATGGATSQAGLDLITARNALFAMPQIPANDLSNLDFGTLAALQPGVYFSTSAVNQTGAIVLDANFQNGVAWVFNLSLSLTTAANSAVTFVNLGTNGGSDNGVYWNAATAINIGDNNTIAGNYLAGTSISFTGITTTLGSGGTRALAGAAVSFAGPGSINPLGGPGGGDFDGGLAYDSLGLLVPIAGSSVVLPPAVVPPAVTLPGIPLAPGATHTGAVLLSSGGSFTTGGSNVLLVPGIGYATTTLDVNGNISNNGSTPASLTITNATVSLSGTNTYTGGTTVNGGQLIAGSTNLPTNGAVALTNSGALIFNQPANGSFGGVISGNGSVTKAGAGALTLAGANTYTGGTAVNAGSLVGTTATLPTGGNVVLANNSTLVFNQTASGTFTGNITGSGTLQKQGSGQLTLSRATRVNVAVLGGGLMFTESLGDTVVAQGAFLGGTGTIFGNLVNHGTVSPGNSPGTINVTGNFTQTSTGTLVIELASPTDFDRLIMGGSAALAGTLQVNTLGSYVPVNQSFVFLTAPGGVTGTFGTVNGNAIPTNRAAVSANVSYSATAATLNFAQVPFASFASTPNQIATANAAQADLALTAALNVIPAAGQFPAALNALSPQDYQVWSDFAFAHSTALANQVLQSGRMPTGCDDYYFEAGQRRGRARGDLDLGSSTYTATSGLLGGNRALNDNTAVGAFLGFGKTTAGLGSGGISSTTVRNKTLGVRAAWTRGSMFSEAMLAYGMDTYTSNRAIEFPGTSATASSFTRGHQWTAGFNFGQDLQAGSFTLSPFAGLMASRWKANSFTETGAGALSASLGNQRARSLRSQLGAEARYTLGMLQPHVRAAWLHEFSNDSRSMATSFGAANSYALATRAAPRNTMLYSAGVDMLIGPRALLYTDFTAQGGGVTKVLNEWRVGFSASF